MTTKTVTTPAPEPQIDTPPWEMLPRDPAGNEAVSVAWSQIALPFTVFPDDPASDEEPTTVYALWNVTLRGIDPTEMIDQLIQFSGLAAASGAKFVTDKGWTEFAIGQKFVPPPVATSPLPQAQQPGKPWAPQAQQAQQPAGQWTPPQGAAPQQPRQQQQSGELDNTFVAESLLVANKNKLDGTSYIEYRLKGPRYPTFGVRVYPDKLNEVLPGWGEAPQGLYPLPAHYKCTFSWDAKPGKDGTPQPKNVYAMELVQ